MLTLVIEFGAFRTVDLKISHKFLISERGQ